MPLSRRTNLRRTEYKHEKVFTVRQVRFDMVGLEKISFHFHELWKPSSMMGKQYVGIHARVPTSTYLYVRSHANTNKCTYFTSYILIWNIPFHFHRKYGKYMEWNLDSIFIFHHGKNLYKRDFRPLRIAPVLHLTSVRCPLSVSCAVMPILSRVFRSIFAPYLPPYF